MLAYSLGIIGAGLLCYVLYENYKSYDPRIHKAVPKEVRVEKKDISDLVK